MAKVPELFIHTHLFPRSIAPDQGVGVAGRALVKRCAAQAIPP